MDKIEALPVRQNVSGRLERQKKKVLENVMNVRSRKIT
jgi:hypothetical protein